MIESVDAYQQWLQTGFGWLEGNWPDGSDVPWRDARGGFLTALGVSEGDLDEPANRIVQLVMYELDESAERGAGPAELLASRHDVVSRCLAQWEQELAVAGAAEPGAAAAPDAAAAGPTEPQWVEGHGWMQYDPQAGQWVAFESGGETAATEPGPAEPAASNEPAPGEPAADVAAPVEALVAQVMQEALAEVPEAAEIPPDEFAEMLARIVAEELAARSE